ncbi:MAG: acetyl-CoA carboxylase biotin carboxyl carrier protein subunit [Clostridia bacterium]|nr:acetyl-CoA carboxylase biotin carboxyl carrier protein subunit [Clostridia bacterium]
MKNYRVTVNGIPYDVVVEELDACAAPAAPVAPVAAPAAAPAAPAAPVAPKAAPAAPKAAPKGNAGAIAIKAPMPGTLIKVNVKAGDSVKKGDVLCVLEAMKMENDILAPEDGVVATVEATQGASVATDAVLVTLN